jgi:phage terminase large subunit GpA-like protein
MPWWREILDAFSPMHPAKKVVVMGSSQAGKTTALDVVAHYYTDYDPSPVGIYFPSENESERYSIVRGTPWLEENQVKIIEGGGQVSGSTILRKKHSGGVLEFLSANKSSDLRGRSYRIVLLDEVDIFEENLNGEGDPIFLAENRVEAAAFPKIGIFSTPTIEGKSIVHREFLNGTQKVWKIPCKHCNHFQPVDWNQVDIEKKVFSCVECGAEHSDKDLKNSIKLGKWEAQNPGASYESFCFNALMSSLTSMSALIKQFEEARGNIEKLKSFRNTRLGLPWAESVGNISSRLSVEDLMKRRERFSADIPENVDVLTMGVDIQDDWGAWLILGSDLHQAQFSILKAGWIENSPTSPEFWKEIDNIRTARFLTEDGRTLGIEACAVDSGGHRTEYVYNYSSKNFMQRVWAIKGGASSTSPIFPAVPSVNGKFRFYIINPNKAKDTILTTLHKIDPESVGYTRISTEISEKVLTEILSEVRTFARGRNAGWRWQPAKQGVRTEMADCLTYAYAALVGLQTNHSGLLENLKLQRSRSIAGKSEKIQSVAASEENSTKSVPKLQPKILENPRNPRQPRFRQTW